MEAAYQFLVSDILKIAAMENALVLPGRWLIIFWRAFSVAAPSSAEYRPADVGKCLFVNF